MAWQNNGQQNAPKNYEFVSFPQVVDCSYITDISKRTGEYSGVISLNIKVVDDLYIGSGTVDFDSRTGLSTKTMIENGHAVIPGSSVKGAIRHVARAISEGCIENSDARLKLAPKQRGRCNVGPKQTLNVCIVCDMFGMMGLGSKIAVSDFTAEKCTIVQRKVPAQFSPHPDKPCYLENDRHIGYKFYYTICDSRDMLQHFDTIYAVKAGTVFTGEIRFTGLKLDELRLLMHSLGIGGTYFSHKLGGYRADGFGTVNFICTGFILNGKESTPKQAIDYACQYVDHCSDDCYEQLKELRNIMEYVE